jgi:uncharacterized protein
MRPDSSAVSGQRNDRIDALRGFALFGILLVNIQSFSYGATNPLGYIDPQSSVLDRTVYFATAAFVSVKFMPLFAMLFGAGFSLLYRKLQARSDQPKRFYRRRMAFLFVFGVLHGVLFYYGDITHMYALAGLVLLAYVERDAAGIGRAAIQWWIGAAIFNVLVFTLLGSVSPPPDELAPLVQHNFDRFVALGYLEQLPLRAEEFANVALGNLFGFPLTVALMLTGMWAERAGLPTNLHARAWRIGSWLGLLVGLPAALIFGYSALGEADVHGLGATTLSAAIPQLISVSLAFFYAASVMRYAPDVVVRLLAPAGRMPLTNYFLQSVAMGAALSGWGLALGLHLSYWQTAALAALIFALQIAFSRLWLSHAQQGPLEALWRKWTYHGLPLDAKGAD